MTRKAYIGLLVILLLSAFYTLPAQAAMAPVAHPILSIRAPALPDSAIIISGDWVVTGTEVHKDEVIVLTGNLVVEPGGNLTLVNCTLLMNCTCPEEFGITVEKEGVLKVVGSSNITALWLSLGLEFWLEAEANSTLFFKGSFFSGFSYMAILAKEAVLENCTITGPGNLDIEAPYDGATLAIRDCRLDQLYIYVYGYNGPVIEGNEIANAFGLEIDSCPNCEIIDNKITGCFTGMGIYYSDGAVIRGNEITDNALFGIFVSYSDGVVVEDNYIADNGGMGLTLSGCTGATVRYNTFVDDGLLISGFSQDNYDTHTISDNTVNGKPIYYVVGASGYTAPSDAGEVIVASSSSVLIQGLSFSGTDVGIIVAFSDDVDVVGVEAYSMGYAVRCISCSDVNITDAHVEGTDYAIDLWDCDSVLLDRVEVSGGVIAINVWGWTEGLTVLDSEIRGAGYCGLYASFSSHINLTETHVASCYCGVYCFYCDHITVDGCVIEDCDRGLDLECCEDMTVEDCVFIKDGIYVEGWSLSEYMFTSFSNNTVNGKPIYYVASTSGYTVPSDAGQVIIVNSTGITVDGVNASYTDVGILVVQSKGVTIRNAVLEHDDYGILVVLGCEGITVQGGRISGCEEGISASEVMSLTAQGLEITGCDFGIYVDGGSDVAITGCTMSDCDMGIYAWFVEDITVSNCHVSRCFSGIRILASDGVSVLDCHLADNPFGIYCSGCDGVVVKGNEVSDSSELGLSLKYCENMTICDNAFTDDGIGFEGYDKRHFMVREFSNNTVNGKPIYYVVNATGYTVPSDAGQVIIVNSTGIVVSGLTITDTDIAIIVAFSQGVSISGCTLEDNSRHGLYCYEAEVSVEDTTVAKSRDEGIYCVDAVLTMENCNITGNDDAGIHVEYGVLDVAGTYITNNTGYGVKVWSTNVTLTACVISGNEQDGICVFSFWIVSVVHVENCTISHNSQGIYVLGANLTVIRCEITGNEYDGISCYSCPSVEVHDSSIYGNGGYGLYAYYCTVNATNNWWNSTTGPELTFMPPDEVDPEEVWVCYGTIIYKPFLTAPPYVPPVDTEPPSLAITEPSEGALLSGTVIIRVSASDPSGVANVTFYIDGTPVFTDTEAPYEYEWDTTAYADGSHTIKVEAYDTYGNKAEVSITVTVDNTPPVIGTPSISPEEPVEGEDVTVSVNVTDATSGVAEVILSYSTDGGATWKNVTMTAASTTYEATIPGQPAGTEVLYKIYARDGAGNWAVSAQYSYTVKAKPAPPAPPGPAIPPTIAGIPTIYIIGGAIGAVIAVAALAWAIKRKGL